MVNPTDITDAIVATLRTIPELVTAMNSDPSRISAYHYILGKDNRLSKAQFQTASPSIMVMWDGTNGGNFSGYEVWKHRFMLYIRAANQANNPAPIGYETLWYYIVNGKVNGTQ